MVMLAPVRTIVFGLLIVGFLVFEPHGLAEIWRPHPSFFSPVALPVIGHSKEETT
jgi:branched-chain amino acid transport system permease protein